MSKYLVLNSVKDDKLSISYKPLWNSITKSVISTIILQQCIYWWRISNEKPFYKFLNKCKHTKYRRGDSWCEELGLSAKEFSHGLKMIGFKRGKTKNLISKENALIIYFRDNNGLTYYTINEDVLGPILDWLYKNDNSLVNDQKAYTKEAPFEDLPLKTEINAEINIHKEAISSQSSEISEASELKPKQEIPIKKPLPQNPTPEVAPCATVPKCLYPTANYNVMVFVLWKQKMGGAPLKSNLKAIKELCGEYGLPTVEKALKWYLSNTDALYISLPSFCSKFGVYLQKAGGKELTQAEKDERDAKLYQKPRDQTLD